MARRRKPPDQEEIARHEQQVLKEFKAHPGWEILAGRLSSARDGYFRNLARTLYAGTEVTKEELAYKRGFFRGANWLLRQQPWEAEKALELIERELGQEAQE